MDLAWDTTKAGSCWSNNSATSFPTTLPSC
jgi:hypothetical protein